MPNFKCADELAIFGLGQAFASSLTVARALGLLAVAAAPGPHSRYQPGANWSVVKYSTAIEPRMNPSRRHIAVANVGIWDLDPHQKTVLADDLGVGLALAMLDRHFGIAGIADCYGLWRDELLVLKGGGGHRQMPDFVVQLNRSINGSKRILLECKGSTQAKSYESQLDRACEQLDNVSTCMGANCASGKIPRVAIATVVHPGTPVQIHISDPPEDYEASPDLERKLRANYLALELAALGDMRGAEKIRSQFDLRGLRGFGIEAADIKEVPEPQMETTAFVSLPAFKPSPSIREDFDEFSASAPCMAEIRFKMKASPKSLLLRDNPADEELLYTMPSETFVNPQRGPPEVTEIGVGGVRIRTRERDRTSIGMEVSLDIDVRRAI